MAKSGLQFLTTVKVFLPPRWHAAARFGTWSRRLALWGMALSITIWPGAVHALKLGGWLPRRAYAYPCSGSRIARNAAIAVTGLQVDLDSPARRLQPPVFRCGESSVATTFKKLDKPAPGERLWEVRPVQPLPAGGQCHLVIEAAVELVEGERNTFDAEFAVADVADKEPPAFDARPSQVGVCRREGVRGSSEKFVRIATVVADNRGPTYLDVALRMKKKPKNVERRLIWVRDGEIELGWIAGSSNFALWGGIAYVATITAVDSAGNRSTPAEVDVLLPAEEGLENLPSFTLHPKAPTKPMEGCRKP